MSSERTLSRTISLGGVGDSKNLSKRRLCLITKTTTGIAAGLAINSTRRSTIFSSSSTSKIKKNGIGFRVSSIDLTSKRLKETKIHSTRTKYSSSSRQFKILAE